MHTYGCNYRLRHPFHLQLHRGAQNLRQKAGTWRCYEPLCQDDTHLVADTHWLLSHDRTAYDAESYFPELTYLAEEVRKVNKTAKFVLSETWSYGKDYRHEKYGENPMDQAAMTEDVINAYREVSKRTGFPLISVGEYIAKAREAMGDIMNRDGFHLNELGRALGGLIWAYSLFGKKPLKYYPKTGHSYDDITPGLTDEQWKKLVEIASK